MSVYLKFDEKRMPIEEIEEAMYSGSIKAAKCLGNYYAKKRKINNDNYYYCIFYYRFGAEKGCPECMIKVSKYACEYARLLDDQTFDKKYYYISISARYAFKAVKSADTKTLRSKAMNCIKNSYFLINENNNLIKKYIK